MTDENEVKKGSDNELSTLMKLAGDEGVKGTEALTLDKEMAMFVVGVTQALTLISTHQAHHCQKISELEDKIEKLMGGDMDKMANVPFTKTVI